MWYEYVLYIYMYVLCLLYALIMMYVLMVAYLEERNLNLIS